MKRLGLPAALLVMLLLPLVLTSYTQRVMDLAVISAIAVVGLVFAFGYAGLVHLGQAAFVGVGAYCSAGLTTRLGFTFWEALPLSLAAGAVLAVLIGAPMLRLRGHYLALATVGLNVTVEIIAKNWVWLTGGEDGVNSIPGVSLFGRALATDRAFYYLALGFLVVAMLIGFALRRSRYGRAMIAVRDDELACGASGVTAFRAKLLAFTLASVYGAASGVLYAHYASYIAPSDFDLLRAITLLVMLIVGGEASIPGAVAGAVLVSFAPEWLRFLGEAYQTAFGIGIIVVLVLLPDGLAGVLQRLARVSVRRVA
jgi:branched-chain amino acid transport system permease protein